MDEFPDTIQAPRKPMPFEPQSYVRRRAGLAMCRANACRSGRLPCPTPDACRQAAEDSDFGALEGLARGLPYVAAAWAIIAVIAVAAWLIWR